MSESIKFRSNGKLLISGEYLVLKGAKALAIPTKFGQSLEISKGTTNITWLTHAQDQKVYEGQFTFKGGLISESGEAFGENLTLILKELLRQKGDDFLKNNGPIKFDSHIEFPLNWGLGSSATLISNVCKWAQCDPFEMLFKISSGSGFDIACASSKMPLHYQLVNGVPNWEEVELPNWYEDELFFVHLNRKMRSNHAVKDFNEKNENIDEGLLKRVSEISESLSVCQNVSEFENLIDEHEAIVSDLLKSPTIKELEFSDFPNTIKSLGAWGGDFILAVGGKKEEQYFKDKGYSTVLRYNEMFKSLQEH